MQFILIALPRLQESMLDAFGECFSGDVRSEQVSRGRVGNQGYDCEMA